MLRRSSILFFCLACLTLAQQIGSAGDWPDWRGPDRDGVSREKGLPEKWSLGGQNLAWKAPYGGAPLPSGSAVTSTCKTEAEKSKPRRRRSCGVIPTAGKHCW